MLLKRKYFYRADDEGDFHLVEKKAWLPPQKPYDRLINLHLHTFCGADHQLAKNDEYVEYDKEKHRKRLCEKCFKMFKLSRRKAR